MCKRRKEIDEAKYLQAKHESTPGVRRGKGKKKQETAGESVTYYGKESGSTLRSDESLLLFWRGLRLLFQVNSSNSALASCKSVVSNPSVNQP